jgi:hypothetical protein
MDPFDPPRSFGAQANRLRTRLGFVCPERENLARCVVEQPGDVVGVEPGLSGGGGRDHDSVELFACDRLPERVAVCASAFDPGIDLNAVLGCSLLDRFVEPEGGGRVPWQGDVKPKLQRHADQITSGACQFQTILDAINWRSSADTRR